jgi:hypothetical protein
MKILKESVCDVSNNFFELEELLDDADYVVSIYSKVFEYVPNSGPFNIENLRDIFSDATNEINGTLNTVSWNSAYEKISKNLSYATYMHGIERDLLSSFRIVSESILEERINLFKDIIKKYIRIPAKEVIEHIPARPSYFGNFLIWGLCLILLNEKHGIVIYFETSD